MTLYFPEIIHIEAEVAMVFQSNKLFAGSDSLVHHSQIDKFQIGCWMKSSRSFKVYQKVEREKKKKEGKRKLYGAF